MLEFNVAVRFPIAPLLTVILALVGEYLQLTRYDISDCGIICTYLKASTCCAVRRDEEKKNF